MSYDLFGNGKTAIKATLGRYVVGVGVDQARLNNPVVTTVQTATRTWTDSDRDFVPDGDLANPLLNGELGQISDLGFGQTRVLTRYAEDTMEGFGNRGSSWQSSVSIQHELTAGVALNVGWFRTWSGNIRTTNNLAVTPADFDPYSIPAPADARLPGGGNYTVTGLYDVKQNMYGQINNLVTQSSNFGEQTEVFNGLDFTLNVRPSGTGILSLAASAPGKPSRTGASTLGIRS